MDEKLTGNKPSLIESLGAEEYCYLTTIGRVTGNPHQIEIWFGSKNHTLYLLSGGLDKSDWVKNLLKNPDVTVRVGKYTFPATARLVKESTEEMSARNMVADKYHEREADDSLDEWARTALVVGIDVNPANGQ